MIYSANQNIENDYSRAERFNPLTAGRSILNNLFLLAHYISAFEHVEDYVTKISKI